jgi:hypothetical protein
MKKIPSLVTVLTVTLVLNSLSIAQVVPGPRPEPTPNPPVTPNPPPPPPAKKELDGRRTEEIAKAGAEVFASDVLEFIADAYQVRFNLREGILSGKSRIGDYDNDSTVRRSSLYNDNYDKGSRNGRARGIEAGSNYSQRAAYNLADGDIGAAIDTAIDNQTPIVLNPNPRMIPFDGLNSNLSVPRDVVTRLVDGKSTTESEVKRLIRDEISRDMFQQIFEIRSIYREHRTEMPDEYKYDGAFENFIRNTFNTRNSRAEEVRKYYQEIRDGNVYAKPQDNERAFRQAFLYNYGRMIDRSWRERVQANNNRARNLGEDIYVSAADSLATELGNFDGYNSQYKSATKEVFLANFINDYNVAYPQIVQKIKTTSHLTAVKASLVPSSGKAEVAYGDTLDVVLHTITNRGMVDGVAKIEAVSANQVLSTNNPQSVTVKGLTRDSEVKTFSQMSKIASINGVDESITASVVIDGQIYSSTLRSSYEEKIRRLCQSQDPAIVKALLDKTLSQMKAQYDDLSGWGDQYEKRRDDMLLVRVLKLYKSPGFSEAEKAQLKTYKKQLRNVFGSQPNRFSPKRDEWESAWKMLKEMGM